MTFLVNRARRAALFGIAALLALAAPAQAADYPSRPVMLVVAFPPGGPSDVLARIVGKKMEQLLGQPFVIENQPGAGGNIAAEAVAHADAGRLHAADGQQQHPRHQREPLQEAHLSIPEKDFVPITLIGTQANILVVNPKVPVHSLSELIALCAGAARQDQFRLVRLWRGGASRRRTVQGGGASRHRARALQGRGARLAGRDRRPRPDDVRHRRVRGRPHQERPGARAGGDHAQAHGDPARSADHGRSRPERLRRQHLARAGRAGRHAAGDDRQAARRRRQGAAAIRACRLRSASSASISSATRRTNSRPTSRRKSRNGRRS